MTFPANTAVGPRPRALLIEEDPAIQNELSTVVESHGFSVEIHPDAVTASHHFSVPHLIIMGVATENSNAGQFAEWARRKSGRQQPFILALGDTESLLSIPNAAMLWNDVVAANASLELIDSRLTMARQWLAKNHPELANRDGAGDSNFLEQTGLKRVSTPNPEGSDINAPRREAPPVAAPPAVAQTAVVASPFRAAGPPRNRPATAIPAQERVAALASATASATPMMAASSSAQNFSGNRDTHPLPNESRTQLPQARPAHTEIRPTNVSIARPAAPPPPPAPSHNETTPPTPASLRSSSGNEGARMRQLLDHLPMAVALFDREMHYLAANKRWLNDFGLNETEVIGRSHYDVFPDLHENWKRVYQRALDGETQRSDERVVDNPDGTRSWVRWEVTPWDETDSGTAAGILISCQKMTGEQVKPAPEETAKPTEEKPIALEKPSAPESKEKESVDSAEVMLKSAETPAMALDLDGTVSFANRHLVNVLGNDSLAGKKLWEIAGGSQRESLHEACDSISAAYSESGKLSIGSQLDFILFDEEGDQFRLAWSFAPRRDADANVKGIALFGTLRKEDRPASEPSTEAEAETETLEAKLKELEAVVTLLNEEKSHSASELEEVRAELAIQQKETESVVQALEQKLAVARSTNEATPAEKERAEAEDDVQLTSAVLAALPGGIAILDRDAEVIFSNKGFTDLLGIDLNECGSLEEWLQRGSPDDDHASEVKTIWWERVWQAHATKVFSLADSSHVLRDIEFRPKPLSNGRLLLIATDVTDKRRSEDALRTSEARFRTLFRECGVGVAVIDRAGSILNVNPYLERMLGTNLVALRRGKFDSLLSPEDIAAKRSLEEKLLERGDPNEAVELNVALERKDGTWVPVTLRAARVRNQAGKDLFTAYFIRERVETPVVPETAETAETTEPVATPSLSPLATLSPAKEEESPALENAVDNEAETRSSNEMLQRKLTAALLEATPVPVLITDGGGNILECNIAAEDYLESEIDALNGQSLAVLFDEMETEAFSASLLPTLEASGSFEGDVTIVRSSGSDECGLQLLGVNNDEGKLASIIAVIEPAALTSPSIEITEEEPPVEEAVTPPASVDGVRECLHQIKNHLQILMSLQNLQMKKPGDPIAEGVLLSTRNRLNAVAHVYQNVGSTEADAATVLFHHVGEALLQSLQRGWQKARTGVELNWRLDDLRLHTTDAVPLALIINELVSNAFEHGFSQGNSGRIQVRLGVKPKRKLAVLIVTNTGLHMSGENENPEGQGLAIAETLTEQIGGSFRRGEDGKPEFRIVFPLSESDFVS